MSTISQVEGNRIASEYEAEQTKKKSKVPGKTVGNPELSEKAQKYYEELKKKYSNMDFVLVSKDMKQQAQAQAGSYANANRMVVLIDEEKIERMAEDETYRKQYESIIQNASTKLPQLQNSLQSAGANIKTVGMKVNDNGTASFFAVIDKSLSAQRERISKKAEEKKEAKKTAEKKEAKKEEAEKLKDKRLQKEEQEEITITASTMDELIQKINDVLYPWKQIEPEYVGQHINYLG